MATIRIHSSTHVYDVTIEEGIRHRMTTLLEGDYSQILIITDETVAGRYLEEVKRAVGSIGSVHTAVVPAGEGSKSMDQYSYLLDRCVEAKLDRRALIIALGGGMIGDLAGFVASTYLRGVPYVQMPTTILAHDSSVGGKVAINHSQGKNLIGSFYSPVHVIYDLETLTTLPEKEIRSGYGEVIKHAFLSDAAWVEEVLETNVSRLSSAQLQTDLKKGIRVKASIVEQDEKEAGVRKYLNLGHTLAHAVESELGYGEVTHGEAVAIGLSFAFRLSSKVLGSDLPEKEYVNWLNANGYPLSILKTLNSDRLVHRMKWDKKTVHQHINFVLLDSIGQPVVQQVDDEVIMDALRCWMNEVIGNE
ncbi:3-dehydroquinate synthase [Halobacillus sp. ACCC02827]|uniref:3-dehydroquinate synthase n=1 Tax=Halobacillus sp. ACCC02827 TaxID=3052090 RepID=UPI00257072C5|nr:3-dehydroquinate synthase [Halobacillus sp. ACCC02827]WJE14091.1 3-dehydroquinate synthase [Halobacillus sp. ACCC02827]